MSRGFVKEGDQEEAVIIPQRAPLPPGVVNYVTAVGYRQLADEKEELLTELANIPKDNDTEHRRTMTLINGKLALLEERMASARIIELKDQPQDEVRFGALVEIQNGNKQLKFQITGIDEADVKKQKIAFTAPIAKAITGAKEGDTVSFRLGGKMSELKILKICYQ